MSVTRPLPQVHTRETSPPQQSPKRLRWPLLILLTFWLGSALLFLLLYPANLKPNADFAVAYLLAASAIFTIGYVVATRVGVLSAIREPRVDSAPIRLIVVSSIFMMASAVLLATSLNLASIEAVFSGFSDLGDAYNARKAYQDAYGAGDSGTLVVSLFFPLFPFAIPLSIVYWESLNRFVRLLVTTGALLYAGYFIASGTMKGLGDLAILAIVGTLVRNLRSSRRTPEQEVGSARRRITASLIAGFLVVAFLFVMILAFSSRRNYRAATLPMFQPGGPLGDLFGPFWAPGLETALGYYARGYTGLGYALEYSPEVQWYSGFRSLSYLFSTFLGFDHTYPISLPFVVEQYTGYSPTVNWWTVFPWLASSFGWLGALLILGVIGFYCGKLWVDAVRRRSNLAVGVLGFLMIGLFAVPANNQLFLSTSSTFGFLFLSFLYLARKLLATSRAAVESPGPAAIARRQAEDEPRSK